MNKAVPLALALVVLMVLSTTNILPAKAQSSQAITIKTDGSVDPSTAPITQNGNIYTLTGNINGSITIEKSDIILDGSGYTIQYNEKDWLATIVNHGNSNVTIKNAVINSAYSGIDLQYVNDSKVINCTISNSSFGISIYGDFSENVIAGNTLSNITYWAISSSSLQYSVKNAIIGNKIIGNSQGIIINAIADSNGIKIIGNQIENNTLGMDFGWGGDHYSHDPNPFYMNNQIYYNNFVNNSQDVAALAKGVFNDHECVNVWDNDTVGNYWGNYNGTDANRDGIGDSPYSIDGNNTDNYPLMSPVNISDALSNMLPSLAPSPSPSLSPSPSPTFTSPSPSPTATPTPSPSPTPAPTPTPSLSPSPSIPEFPSFMVVSFSMVATVLSAILYRGKHSRLK